MGSAGPPLPCRRLTKDHDGAQPLPRGQGVGKEQAGEEDGDELACGHHGGEQQGAKGLDRVAAGREAGGWTGGRVSG